jgi:hypothetical protein
MSKYNLEEIHKSNVKEAMSADDQARFDQLTKDDQLKLEKIFAMMKAEKDAKKSTNEDFDSVVDKIKDSGKSEEDAKKIAGAINAKYVGNYREGVEENGQVDDYTEEIAEENDEDKLPMDEARIDRDVAERIESFIDRSMKAKFIDAFMDIYSDLLEEDNFFPEDIINHLNNEMHAELAGYQRQGDRLAGMEENHAMQGVEAELESGEIGNMDALTEEISEKDIIKALKAANAQDSEIEVYMKSLKQAGDKFDEVDDYVEDFMNYVADKSLQEHFGRFLKDYQ